MLSGSMCIHGKTGSSRFLQPHETVSIPIPDVASQLFFWLTSGSFLAHDPEVSRETHRDRAHDVRCTEPSPASDYVPVRPGTVPPDAIRSRSKRPLKVHRCPFNGRLEKHHPQGISYPMTCDQ